MFWEHLPFLRWPWSYTNHLTPKYIYPKDNWKKKGGGGGDNSTFWKSKQNSRNWNTVPKKEKWNEKKPEIFAKTKVFSWNGNEMLKVKHNRKLEKIGTMWQSWLADGVWVFQMRL